MRISCDIHTHTYIYIHTYTYTHTHTCSVTAERPPVLCEHPDPIADLLEFFMHSRSFCRAGQLNWRRDENERNLSLSLCSFGCSAGFPHQDAQAQQSGHRLLLLSLFVSLREMDDDDMKPEVKEGTRKGKNRTCIPLANRVPRTHTHTHTHIYTYIHIYLCKILYECIHTCTS